LVRVDLTTGALTTLTAAGEASDCTASADGTRVAYVFADFTHPAEVHLLDTASGSDRAVTSLNAAYLDGVLLSTPQPFTVKNPAGDDVYAWFMPAVTTAHAGRRPTVVLIHGGPQTQYGNTFFHEAQYLAGCGYNVVIGDPRGSVGFGHPFEEALVGNWGPPMLEDVTAMVDAVVPTSILRGSAFPAEATAAMRRCGSSDIRIASPSQSRSVRRAISRRRVSIGNSRAPMASVVSMRGASRGIREAGITAIRR
jgi:dipeptidyl aminopeptidase/acylaminoacyl peptidase